jgi:methylglutaconyl-CoA hydratase
MSHTTVDIEKKGSCLTIHLNRPKQRNAINEQMIYELTSAFANAVNDPDLRVILLRGNGQSFSAGADIHWMQKMASFTQEQNQTDAQTLAHLLKVIFNCPIPTLASVQGHVFGGGVGILAACDTVIAEKNTAFCLSEVKLGLIPATIYPYVLHRMGAGATTHLSLTATVFHAADAKLNGLVHEISESSELDNKTLALIEAIQKNSPLACRAAKKLIREILPIPEHLCQLTSERLAAIRISPQGQEGLRAFLEKRQPNWIEDEAL